MFHSSPITVLAVDDDPDFLELTALSLERADPTLSVRTTQDASVALEQFAEHDIDCIVSDYEMPEMSGLDLLEAVRSVNKHIPFILFTGKGTEAVASDAISAGVTDYVQKGSQRDQYTLLANRIQNGVAQYRTDVERQFLLERMSDALIEVDESWQITTINCHAQEIFELDRDEVLGQAFWESFPMVAETTLYDTFHEVMKCRTPVAVEQYCDEVHRWFKLHVFPTPSGGLSLYIRTAPKLQEYTRPLE